MSHVIRISDTTYELMQSAAIPLEDNHDSVIGRALEFYISHHGRKNTPRAVSEYEVLTQNPDSPDDLTHSKIRWARFGNRKMSGRNWSELVKVAHEVAAERVDSFDSLRRITPFNVEMGELEERGYHFFPNANISVQYKSIPDVWENCLQMARNLSLAIEVEFEWPNKEKAAHPGARGRLLWDPARKS